MAPSDPQSPESHAVKHPADHRVDHPKPQAERVYVVHVEKRFRKSALEGAQGWGQGAAHDRLEEAIGLAQAIDLDVVASYICPIARPRPATLIGKGWVSRLSSEMKTAGAALLYLDAALSPIQQRNLEKEIGVKVIDRTGLILEIFGRRAQTAEGRLQVELAALEYQKSRLVRTWTHLERQRGGFGFMGGPGESQLELDKRLLGDRIVAIKKELAQVRRTRGLQRQARQRVPFPIVALVGYTNAGKSTLFNRLTHADVLATDLLFATLDPTMRRVTLPSGRTIILSDTVGFISHLPTHLVAAFSATLEEVIDAQLLLHVRDVAHTETMRQKQDVDNVLASLQIRTTGDHATPLLEVWNKIDLLPDDEKQALQQSPSTSVLPLSARTGEGIDHLLQALDQHLSRACERLHLRIPVSSGKLLAWLYDKGHVEHRQDEDEWIHLDVSLDPQLVLPLLRTFPDMASQMLFTEHKDPLP